MNNIIGKKFSLDLGSLSATEVIVIDIDDKKILVRYVHSMNRMEVYKIKDFETFSGTKITEDIINHKDNDYYKDIIKKYGLTDFLKWKAGEIVIEDKEIAEKHNKTIYIIPVEKIGVKKTKKYIKKLLKSYEEKADFDFEKLEEFKSYKLKPINLNEEIWVPVKH